jgi:hypothetical protein
MSGNLGDPIEIESGSEEETQQKRPRFAEPIVVLDESSSSSSSGSNSVSSSRDGTTRSEAKVPCSFCGELALESRIMLHEKWCLSKSKQKDRRVVEEMRTRDTARKSFGRSAPQPEDDNDDDEDDVVAHVSVGERLLAMAGYRAGRGMGKKEQGRKTPVAVAMYAHNRGLGFERPTKLPFRKKRTR